MSLDGTPKWKNGTAWPTWESENQLATFIDAGITDTVDTKNMKARCERHSHAMAFTRISESKKGGQYDL
jgi:hypothetical protein